MAEPVILDKATKAHPPWSPKLPALPWSPELSAPPRSPELPGHPWLPEWPAPPWLTVLPPPPWSPALPAPPWRCSNLQALPYSLVSPPATTPGRPHTLPGWTPFGAKSRLPGGGSTVAVTNSVTHSELYFPSSLLLLTCTLSAITDLLQLLPITICISSKGLNTHTLSSLV